MHREPSTTTDRPAEVVTLQRTFSYLSGYIDVDAVIPKALSKGLITELQRLECSETSVYKQAEKFLEYLQRAANENQECLHTFLQILEEIGQDSAY